MYRVVLVTDNNRQFLEGILTQDISLLLQELAEVRENQLIGKPMLTRVVYEETFATESMANKKLLELKTFTRMQRERLIRKQNPNWLNLYPSKPLLSFYRSACQAS